MNDPSMVNSELWISSLESYFLPFRSEIIGVDQEIRTANHTSIPMIYADWTASGRAYRPIEQRIVAEILPYIANTHTDLNYSSSYITQQYHEARETIKRHVNASNEDILIAYGSGMTDVINKFQRMLGLRVPEQFRHRVALQGEEVPVIFITHMEHHSNHTSWLETLGEVVVVPPGPDGRVSLDHFEEQIADYQDRTQKIASVTACSNVTGIETPFHEIAQLMHRYEGYCLVDFACSAPYVEVNMHPDDTGYLDAIFFSPHKFLGGPGSTGILLFNQRLLETSVPDVSGGGTVNWTNPWGGRAYVTDIEEREDGGTPAIIQTIRAGYALALKEEMGVANILRREEELMGRLWEALKSNPEILLLEPNITDRLGILSFNVAGKNYNEVVEQLNNQFGIQARGGCSCAGTYGHYLLDVGQQESEKITDLIDRGDTSRKPGWVRVSIHPTMTDAEVDTIIQAIDFVSSKGNRCST